MYKNYKDKEKLQSEDQFLMKVEDFTMQFTACIIRKPQCSGNPINSITIKGVMCIDAVYVLRYSFNGVCNY